MSQPMNPYDSPETGKSGMSGSTKLLLGLGIGCGVLVVVCCGVFGLGGYLFTKSAENAMSKDPAKIREITSQIVTITIPESLPPQMSLDWTIPVWDKKFMTMVAYGEEKGGNILFVMQFGNFIGDEKAMQSQFNQSMRQGGQREWDDVALDESETVKQTINGEEARFTLGRGKSEKTKQEVWQVTGSFHGKGGPAMLMLKVQTDQFTKDQVLEIIRSMQ